MASTLHGAVAGGRFSREEGVRARTRWQGRGGSLRGAVLAHSPAFLALAMACESCSTSSPADCAPLHGPPPRVPAAWLRSAELMIIVVRRVQGIISLSKRFGSDTLQLPMCCQTRAGVSAQALLEEDRAAEAAGAAAPCTPLPWGQIQECQASWRSPVTSPLQTGARHGVTVIILAPPMGTSRVRSPAAGRWFSLSPPGPPQPPAPAGRGVPGGPWERPAQQHSAFLQQSPTPGQHLWPRSTRLRLCWRGLACAWRGTSGGFWAPPWDPGSTRTLLLLHLCAIHSAACKS